MTIFHSTYKHRGFTLVEMAMVMIIVALLLGGLLVPFSMQLDQQAHSQTQQSLDDIKDALIGFALVNRRLPCPDTTGDAQEDTITSPPDNTPIGAIESTETVSCTALEGWLPSQNLQLPDRDFWAKRFRYRVSPQFSNYAKNYSLDGGAAGGGTLTEAYFTLASIGNITIQTRGDDPATAAVVENKFLLNLATQVPAVIISHGKNGYGSNSSQGIAIINPPAINTDETTNSTAAPDAAAVATKISRAVARQQADCSDTDETKVNCEFDDMVTWVSGSILKNRMQAAGLI